MRGQEEYGYNWRVRGGKESVSKDTSNKMTLEEIGSLPIRGYSPRSISKGTMEHFNVRTGLSPKDRSLHSHYYPYYNESGSIVGWKQRILDNKTFYFHGKLNGLFGQNKVKGKNFLIIVEGEHDALAAYEIMRGELDRPPYNVVSLPTGSDAGGVLHQVVKRELEWLSGFNTIVLCLDTDKPGRAMTQSLAEYLCTSTEIRIMTLPVIDTAKMLEEGRQKEWMTCLRNSRKYTADQVVAGTDTELEELIKPTEAGIIFPFLPKTSQLVRGFRTREVNTIIGPPNSGKSSLMREMMCHVLENTDELVGGFFLEETPTKTKQSILSYHAGMPLNEFRANPEKADREKVEEAYDTLLPRLHLFDHSMRVLDVNILEKKIEYMVRVLGCKRIFLDHLSFLVAAMNSNNERRDIDLIMTKLARSVEDWDYTLFQVSHIKRREREHTQSKMGDSYPKWEILDMSDGRGSGAIETCSHNMIALERQILDPAKGGGRGLLRTRVLRNREWGDIGEGDVLSWDSRGRFRPLNNDQTML